MVRGWQPLWLEVLSRGGRYNATASAWQDVAEAVDIGVLARHGPPRFCGTGEGHLVV